MLQKLRNQDENLQYTSKTYSVKSLHGQNWGTKFYTSSLILILRLFYAVVLCEKKTLNARSIWTSTVLCASHLFRRVEFHYQCKFPAHRLFEMWIQGHPWEYIGQTRPHKILRNFSGSEGLKNVIRKNGVFSTVRIFFNYSTCRPFFIQRLKISDGATAPLAPTSYSPGSNYSGINFPARQCFKQSTKIDVQHKAYDKNVVFRILCAIVISLDD